MTVEKIKEIIDEMINEKIASATKLNEDWTPKNHLEIKKLCAEGEVLIELRQKITMEEFKELCK